MPSEHPKSVEVQSQGAEGESCPSSAPMVLPSQPAPLRFTAEPPEGLLAPAPCVSKRKHAVPMQYIQQGISPPHKHTATASSPARMPESEAALSTPSPDRQLSDVPDSPDPVVQLPPAPPKERTPTPEWDVPPATQHQLLALDDPQRYAVPLCRSPASRSTSPDSDKPPPLEGEDSTLTPATPQAVIPAGRVLRSRRQTTRPPVVPAASQQVSSSAPPVVPSSGHPHRGAASKSASVSQSVSKSPSPPPLVSSSGRPQRKAAVKAAAVLHSTEEESSSSKSKAKKRKSKELSQDELYHILSERKIDTSNREHKCDMYDSEFESHAKLRSHLFLSHSKFLCKTSYCECSFNTVDIMRTHFTDKHKKGQYKCDVQGCEQVFEYASGLSAHASVHRGKQYKCDVSGCDKVFSWPRDLRHHKKSHEGDKFRCTMCDFEADEKRKLTQHLMVKHNPPSIACTKCDEKFHSYQ